MTIAKTTPTPPETEAVDPAVIVKVSFYLPASKAVVFQARAAEWLAADLAIPAGSGGTGYTPPFGSTHGPKNPWELAEWTAADRPAAEWLVADLSDQQRAVVRRLVEAGGDGAWTTDLREAGGYAPTQKMSGAFRAISGRCRAVGRMPFWNGGPKDPNRGQKVSVRAGVPAALFAAVLSEVA